MTVRIVRFASCTRTTLPSATARRRARTRPRGALRRAPPATRAPRGRAGTRRSVRVGRLRWRPAQAPERVGLEHVLDRHGVPLGELLHDGARRLEPCRGTGSRSAHARGGGGASVRGPRVVGRALAGRASAASTARCQYAARRRVPCPRTAGARRAGPPCAAAPRPRRRSRGRAGRARGDVPRPGGRVAGLPQAPDDGEPARSRSVCVPDVRRHGSGRGAGGPAVRTASNSCAAHSDLPASSSRSPSAWRSGTSTSTSSAAYRSQSSGSGRVDQSTAECSLARPSPSTSATTAARPTRAIPSRRAAISVSNTLAGTIPCSASRAGPATPRAGPTRRRRPPRAAATGRARRRGRRARCPRPRGAPGRGRCAGRTGSRRRARRRRPRGRSRRRRPRRRARTRRACRRRVPARRTAPSAGDDGRCALRPGCGVERRGRCCGRAHEPTVLRRAGGRAPRGSRPRATAADRRPCTGAATTPRGGRRGPPRRRPPRAPGSTTRASRAPRRCACRRARRSSATGRASPCRPPRGRPHRRRGARPRATSTRPRRACPPPPSRLQRRAHERHDAEPSLPRLLARRVVEDDEAPRREVGSSERSASTSPVSATDHGAIRRGAGTSRSVTSGRSRRAEGVEDGTELRGASVP